MFKCVCSLNAIVLLALLGMVGCGSGSSSIAPPVAVTPAAAPPVKAMLSDVAASGELGSGASMIREGLEALKATDSAKAEGLLKDLDALEGLSDPAAIKSKAKSMADSL